MIVDIIDAISEAIRTNESLVELCEDEYDRVPTILVGQNIETPLPLDSMPAIVLAGVESGEADYQNRTWLINIGVAVGDDEKIVDEEKPGLIQFAGFLNCEKVVEIITTAILKLPFRATVRYIGIQSEIWPVFLGQIVVSINKIWPLSGNLRRE